MSNKNKVHFFITGEGDPELEKLLEKGLGEIGQGFDKTSIDAAPAVMLDALSNEQVPIVIKPV
ncbi:MAG: hypothetical protein OQK98_15510 [Gammaproteobacteria bacterium]|nr:hypothetical protein [Gammaproteobacteria bacterium]